MDPAKAVAAYSRSDAGAGHGTAAILPSDLRTPRTLIRTLDYLFTSIMTLLPPSSSDLPPNSELAQRKALGYSAGFIRDRTRAIRKEFAMQSSWGHEEAIESFERIARWHILCLRELQEEEGTNNDMHIDSAELGRCKYFSIPSLVIGERSPLADHVKKKKKKRLYKLKTTL